MAGGGGKLDAVSGLYLPQFPPPGPCAGGLVPGMVDTVSKFNLVEGDLVCSPAVDSFSREQVALPQLCLVTATEPLLLPSVQSSPYYPSCHNMRQTKGHCQSPAAASACELNKPHFCIKHWPLAGCYSSPGKNQYKSNSDACLGCTTLPHLLYAQRLPRPNSRQNRMWGGNEKSPSCTLQRDGWFPLWPPSRPTGTVSQPPTMIAFQAAHP